MRESEKYLRESKECEKSHISGYEKVKGNVFIYRLKDG